MRPKEIASGVFHFPVVIANVYFVGAPPGPWALVDTGVPQRARQIRHAAEALYGPDCRPQAILLTHGHMDHSGSAAELADFWKVPVFVHALEMPFVTGHSEYPPGDPTVGGFIAFLGRFFHPKMIDLGGRVRPLEAGPAIPGVCDWEWHHTPGHSPGHIALFRPSGGTLLAGDALTTVNLNSLFATLAKTRKVCGPPAPFTADWTAAAKSVQLLAELRPHTIACGHGLPIAGGEAVMQLAGLATDFPFPSHGRYVREPARSDETGIVYLPPKPADPLPARAIGLAVAATAGGMAVLAVRRRKRSHLYQSRRAKADTPARVS